jgi:hypothetical protein
LLRHGGGGEIAFASRIIAKTHITLSLHTIPGVSIYERIIIT